MFFFICNKTPNNQTKQSNQKQQNKKIAQILSNNYTLLDQILQGKEVPDQLIKILSKKIPNMDEKQSKKLLESYDFLGQLCQQYDLLSDVIFNNITQEELSDILTYINGKTVYKLLKQPKTQINLNIPTRHPVYNIILSKKINQIKSLPKLLFNYHIISKDAYKLYQYEQISSRYLSDFLKIYEASTYNNDTTYIVYHFIYLLEKYDSSDSLHLIQEYVNNMMHYFSNSYLGYKLEAALIKYIIRLDVSQLSTSAIGIIECIIEKKDQYSQYSSKKIEYIKDLLKLKMIIYKIKLSSYSSASLKLLTNMIKDVSYDMQARKKAVKIYNIIITEIVPNEFLDILIINKKNLCSR